MTERGGPTRTPDPGAGVGLGGPGGNESGPNVPLSAGGQDPRLRGNALANPPACLIDPAACVASAARQLAPLFEAFEAAEVAGAAAGVAATGYVVMIVAGLLVAGDTPVVQAQDKVPVEGKSAKEAAKDVPSWAKGNRPKVGESGKDFAKRLLDEKYGPGNYPKGPGSEFNKVKKWGDRAFRDP
jgi:hypothetical protein